MTQNLQVEHVDLHLLKNATSHRTNKYDLIRGNSAIPVLRRGQTFTISIKFKQRAYEKNTDNVRLIFNFGSRPDTAQGTKGIIKLHDTSRHDEGKGWFARNISVTGVILKLEVCSPSDCPVGLWNLYVETGIRNSTVESTVVAYPRGLYILFNPWNSNDVVYMPDTRLLDEYVLQDMGKIWMGSWDNNRGRMWFFGQFDSCVLPAIMLMFQRSQLDDEDRGNPMLVSRTISKLVNANDDGGILTGKWDGKYENGTSPSAWTGSVEIMRRFLHTQRSVNYGQCWVFGGVVTTVCRALGIPSRVITCFLSAHDANATLTVDVYYNRNYDEMGMDPFNPRRAKDSIWNFHVWNDAWMARPDLPKGYGGWQAIDATPQEVSSDPEERGAYFQCGPASLQAVKQGEVEYKYDVAFVISMVNSDYVKWLEDPTTEHGYRQISVDKHHVGKLVSTKKPFMFDQEGNEDREDITDQYKAEEGSEEERINLRYAARVNSLAKKFFSLSKNGQEDVELQLEQVERKKLGENFKLTLNITNTSEEVRHVKVLITVSSMFYTGVKANLVKKEQDEIVLEPNGKKQVIMTLTPEEYTDKLVEYCMLKVYAVATVTETDQVWGDELDFQAQKPTIDIQFSSAQCCIFAILNKYYYNNAASYEIPRKVHKDTAVSITLSFKNPLNKMLTECVFSLAGPILEKSIELKCPNVRPGNIVKATARITPRKKGAGKLIATFCSRELVDVSGFAIVKVKSKPCVLRNVYNNTLHFLHLT